MEVLNETSNVTSAVERQDGGVADVIALVIFVLTMVVAVLATLINAAILIAFLVQKIRRPVRVSPAGLVVLNLLFADTFYSVFIILYFATWSKGNIATYPHWWCSFALGFTHLAVIGSYTALVNVVVDRFIAIRYTLKYRDIMTRKRILLMVCAGWLLPVAGPIASVAMFSENHWHAGIVICTDIESVKMFLWCVFIPCHFGGNVCVLVLQSRICWILRRQDSEIVRECESPRMLSEKSARLLYRVIIPLCMLTLWYDVVLLIITFVRFNKAMFYLYRMTVVFIQISFLLNVFLYSFATASIRNPVCDLFEDIRRLVRKSSARGPSSSRGGVAVTETATSLPVPWWSSTTTVLDE